MLTSTQDIVRVNSTDGYTVAFNNTPAFTQLLNDPITNRAFADPELRMQQRRNNAPGFSSESLNNYLPIMCELIESTLARLATAERFDLRDEIRTMTVDLANSLLGGFWGFGCGLVWVGWSRRSTKRRSRRVRRLTAEHNAAELPHSHQPPPTRTPLHPSPRPPPVGITGLDTTTKRDIQDALDEFQTGLMAISADATPGSPFQRGMAGKRRLFEILGPLLADQRDALMKEGAIGGAAGGRPR